MIVSKLQLDYKQQEVQLHQNKQKQNIDKFYIKIQAFI